MNAQTMLEYILPVAISLMVLWVAYRLLFTNSNRFQFNRCFLLSALLFSLSLPLIGLFMGQTVPQVIAFKEQLFYGFMLNEVTISYGESTVTTLPEIVVSQPEGFHISLWQVLGIVYLLGVLVMGLLFLFKMGRLIALIIRSPKQKMDGYTAVYTHRDQGSFSFFRYAFFPDETVSPNIVQHEKSHIAHGHSWDILFVELMMVLQWFNPFIYLYKRELQSLHEYTADHDVVANGVDKRNYMMLILQQCTAVDFSSMSNNFSLILTKKRIKMITRNEKARRLWWRLLATIPVLALLLFANAKVTAQEKHAVDEPKSAVDVPLKIELGNFEVFDDHGAPMHFIDTVLYNEDGSYIKCETTDALDPISGEPRKKISISTFNADGSPNQHFSMKEVGMQGDTITYNIEPFTLALSDGHDTKISSDNLKIRVVSQQDRDSIYNIVEQMPEFPGGVAEMMTYLSGNIKYPEEAKDKGISGRVFISFVVEKDGSVNQVKVMKGIGGGCDDEAVRVVKAMPKWKPGLQKGKPVRVSYMLPIAFKLDEGDKSPEEQMEQALEKAKKPNKDGVYQIAETMPEYPGGMDGLRTFIQENLTVPEKYKDMDTKADYRVFVQFVVAEDGSITNVELLKPEPSKKDLNDEAVRVVKGMPKWKPGTVDGKPVKVRYTLPVTYRLGK
jgi:TonB family protein